MAKESYLDGRAIAGDAPTIEEWQQLIDERAANDTKFYELAKEFCLVAQTESAS